MKKIYILLIFLIVNLKIFGENFNYFRHINGSEDTDYETGKRYWLFIDSIFDFVNQNDIISADIEIIKYGEKYNNQIFYNEAGQIIKKISTLHETSTTTYNYDENDYLLAVDIETNNFHYDYIAENQRDFYQKDIFEFRETIYSGENAYTVRKERINPNTNELTVDLEKKYFYKDNKIQTFQDTGFNRNGEILYITNIDFKYNSQNKIKEIVWSTKTKNVETRKNIFTFIYDENNQIIEIQKKDYIRPKETRRILLYNFDEYGNWTSRKVFNGDITVETNTRNIKYRN